MEWKFNKIQIDNHLFSSEEFINFCNDVLNNSLIPNWEKDIYRFILEFTGDSDYIEQKTSGTTGTPKIIRLQKQMLIESAKNTIQFFGLQKSQNAALCLPVQYIAGKMMIIRALLAEMNLFLIEPNSKPDFSSVGKTDFCAMVPMQVFNLLNNKLWSEIKTLIIGGAEISNELKSKLQTLKTAVYETFGMAETGSHIALKKINGKNQKDFFSVLAGISISKDKRGCLVIDGTFLPEKIITNDLVEIIDERHFKWLGRFDHVVNSGGIKIQVEELEKNIAEILKIPCAISWKSDKKLGQKIILFVESNKKIDPEEIKKLLADKIAKNMLPKEIYPLKSIPRNSSLKIDRQKLKIIIPDPIL